MTLVGHWKPKWSEIRGLDIPVLLVKTPLALKCLKFGDAVAETAESLATPEQDILFICRSPNSGQLHRLAVTLGSQSPKGSFCQLFGKSRRVEEDDEQKGGYTMPLSGMVQ